MTAEQSMVIEGYASLFGRVDRGGDMVMPGAFARCLAQRGARSIRMLFQHDPGEPIGVWTDIAEDERGLRVRGRLAKGVRRAEEVAAVGLCSACLTCRCHRTGSMRAAPMPSPMARPGPDICSSTGRQTARVSRPTP